MATLRFLLDTRSTNKLGEHPVKISIGHRKTNTTINVGIYLSVDKWDAISQRSNNRYIDYKSFNNKLDILYGDYKKIIDNLTETGKIDIMSVSDVRERLVNSKNTHYSKATFTSFISDFIEKARIKTDTYVYAHNTIHKFSKGRNILFEEINYSWLNKFEDYLIDCGLAVNTRFTIFKAIRSVFNKAIDEEIIGQEVYPFRRFKLKTETTQKRSLSITELRVLKDYPCKEYQERYRDIFMLTFYLMGINAIDLLNLKDIKNGKIEYRRAKTGRLYSIKIEPEAQILIDKYRGEGYLLNVLDTYKNYKDFLHRLNLNLQSMEKVSICDNDLDKIKIIEDKDVKQLTSEDKKNLRELKYIYPYLTTYWARHTWATIAASLDVPKETIAEALGHGGNSVTDIYINFDQRKVDHANRKVIDYLLGCVK